MTEAQSLGFLRSLSPSASMAAISAVCAVLLLCLSLFVPFVARYAPVGWSLPIAVAGIWVLAASPPLAPIASLSVLSARLAWFGRYFVGGLVLLGGLVLASAFDQGTAQERVDGAVSVLTTVIVPTGFLLVGIVLLVDLARLPENQRRELISTVAERRGWVPLGALPVVSFIGAGLSHPILVGVASLVTIFYLSSPAI